MKDGGAAFPRSGYTVTQAGMSLRDWFAGMALNGLTSSPHLNTAFVKDRTLEEQVEWLATRAYLQADAMLKEREKE